MSTTIVLDSEVLNDALDFVEGHTPTNTIAQVSLVKGALWANAIGLTRCTLGADPNHPPVSIPVSALRRISRGTKQITVTFTDDTVKLHGKGVVTLPVIPVVHVHLSRTIDMPALRASARSTFEMDADTTRLVRTYQSKNRTMRGAATVNGFLVATDAIAAVFHPKVLSVQATLPSKLFEAAGSFTVLEQPNNELIITNEQDWYVGLRVSGDVHPVFDKVYALYAQINSNFIHSLRFWPDELVDLLRPWSADDQALHIQVLASEDRAVLTVKSGKTAVQLDLSCTATDDFSMTLPITPLLKYMAFAPTDTSCTLGMDGESPAALCYFDVADSSTLMLTRTS